MQAADVAVVGGGPAGLSTAHALIRARPGIRVAVLERSDVRPRGAHFGITPNGVRAMEAISPELRHRLARHHTGHTKMRRFSPEGELTYSSDYSDGTAAIEAHGPMISLPWHCLQRELADALPPGVLHTNHRFLQYNETADGVVAEFATPEGVKQIQAQLLVGCDGGQSQVREQMLGDGPPSFMGMAIWRAVRPIPEDWILDEGTAWWGVPGRATVLATTLLDGMMSWQAFAPWPADQLPVIGGGRKAYIQDSNPAELAQQAQRLPAEEVAAQRMARCLAMFEDYPQVVKDLIASTEPNTITEHGQFTRDLESCKTYAKGRIALVGDAAHLGAPFLAQGCSQAIEDALELGRAVGQYGPTPKALAAYQEVRVPQAGAVQAASIAMLKAVSAGRMDKAEHQVNIDEGFVQRTHKPLQPVPSGSAAA